MKIIKVIHKHVTIEFLEKTKWPQNSKADVENTGSDGESPSGCEQCPEGPASRPVLAQAPAPRRARQQPALSRRLQGKPRSVYRGKLDPLPNGRK